MTLFGRTSLINTDPFDTFDGTQNNEILPAKKFDSNEITVLVVEDNVSNFVLIARLLGYIGAHCEWKTSGYEVVEYADTLPRLDLILLDIRLPYEDGYEALKKLRQSPKLKNSIIVAITAEASMEQMTKAKNAGFDGFLGKPINIDKFPEQIQKILGGEPVWELY